MSDAVEMRQRELKSVCSFIGKLEQERGVLTRVSWFSGNNTPSTYTIATSEAEDERISVSRDRRLGSSPPSFIPLTDHGKQQNRR